MTKLTAVLLCSLGILTACGGQSTTRNSPQLRGLGIINSSRINDNVVVLYQRSSTTPDMIQAAGNKACATSGDRAINPRTLELGRAGNIPGVDGKVIFVCA